jgi:hypothetical protein
MKLLRIAFVNLFCLLTGLAFSQTPQQLQADLPKINGWEITPEIEIFNQDNLYTRINGAAPLFLENNFQEMTSLVYTKGDDYITIQAYRHATSDDAFGMYSSERSTEMEHYPEIGGEAQGDEYGLFFFSGSVYVKMSASNTGEEFSKAMQEIAKGLAAKIDAKATYPAIFEAFPEDGVVAYSQAYITQNYIGHEFLKPAYTVNYKWKEKEKEKEFQAFVIDGKTAEDAKKIIGEYFKFTKQGDKIVEGKLLLKDKYNGNIPIVWKDRYIIGVFNEKGEDFPKDIYTFLQKFKL